MTNNYNPQIDFEGQISYLETRLEKYIKNDFNTISGEYLFRHLLDDFERFATAEEKCKYADRLEKLKEAYND